MVDVFSLLIVANSARMLVQQAANLGFSAWAIDCYADCDTQKLTKKCIRVDSLALHQVKKATDELLSDFNISHVIYGSGLEQFQDTLSFLSSNFTLIGNEPDVFSSLQNKACFYSKLNHLQIPYPEITFQRPDENCGWLVKPLVGQGGLAIEKYTKHSNQSMDTYWQKYIDGVSMSVLFVADGSDYRLIGFNKQLEMNGEGFIFSGVINQPEVCYQIKKTVSEWLAVLVKEFAVRGINSLDFIVSDKQCFVLELNPRPSASQQLYSDRWLKEHINSFIADKPELVNDEINCRAYKIIFAKVDCFIKKNINWPKWVVDIPQVKSIIYMGMPICSIIAEGKNEQQVKEILRVREQKLSKLLG